MEGAWVEPHFDAGGAYLVAAVTDMVGHHVESRGIWFDRDVSPRISFLVVRGSVRVIMLGGAPVQLLVTLGVSTATRA